MTRLALYAGGFLGPFGGGMIAVLIPPLRDALGASTELVSAGITVYLVPFAALQLVSGTLGERWGLARTVRTAYLAYALVSVAAAFARESRCSSAAARCRASPTRSSPRCCWRRSRRAPRRSGWGEAW